MTKDRIIPIISVISVMLIISFAALIPNNYWKLLFSVLFLLGSLGISYIVKKRSILSINKKQVLYIMITSSLLYILILIALGIVFGFAKSLDLINLYTLPTIIVPSILIIISIEIIRRVFLSQESKFMTVMSFTIGVLSDLLIYSNLLKFTSFNVFMELVGMILLPSIPANILFTHVGKKYGTKPNMIYRLVLYLYPYISPVVASTPDILESILKLIIPMLIFGFIVILYTNKNRQKVVKKSPFAYVGFGVFFVLMISIAMLMSCQFKYGMLVVGSGSMSGEIEVGDAIIYRQYLDKKIEIGDIVVFEKNGSKIIHRIVDIKYDEELVKYYTKGDALDHNDEGFITSDDIVGYVTKKIVYIGYPTLWLRELFM